MDEHELVSAVKSLANKLDKTPTRSEALLSGLSCYAIRMSGGWNALLRKAGLDTYNDRRSGPPPLPDALKRKPRILYFDIETSPILGHVWGMFDQNLSMKHIDRDWFVMSFAAKWHGEEDVIQMDIRAEKSFDDSALLMCIHKLLCEADIAVGQNSIRFDVRKLNARFLKHDMRPPTSYRNIDTLRISKKHFALTSHKLEYLAKYLGCDTQKMVKRQFEGQELWNECLKGNQEAWNEMADYNKTDVVVLEEVWRKLRKWDKTINWSIFSREHVCDCGSSELSEAGEVFTNHGVFNRYLCADCGKEFRERSNLLSAADKRGMLA